MLQVQGGSLERIASALERIADCLEKIQNNDGMDLSRILLNPSLWGEIRQEESIESVEVEEAEESEISEVLPVVRSYKMPLPFSVPQDEREEIIIRYLEEKNITIQEITTEFDPELERIAMFIGDRLDNLRDFCDRLKRCFNTPGQKQSLDLFFSNEKKIADINELVRLLVRIDILHEGDFEYHRDPIKRMDVTIDGKREGEGFIIGWWLEYYLRSSIDSLIDSLGKEYEKPINFSRLSNIKVQFSGGRHAELDLLYEIEGNIFWFEAKTEKLDKTGTRSVLQKYTEYARLLNLKPHKTYMVHIHPDNGYLNHFADDNYQFTVLDIDNFLTKFKKELEQLVVLV